MLEFLFCLLASLVCIEVGCFVGWHLIFKCVVIILISFDCLIIIGTFAFIMNSLYNDYIIILAVIYHF